MGSQHLLSSFKDHIFIRHLIQAAEHERELSASLSKGFIVAGASAGGNLSASVALRARDDPFFKDRNLTGQILHYPALCHPDVYPEKSVFFLQCFNERAIDYSITDTKTSFYQWTR